MRLDLQSDNYTEGKSVTVCAVVSNEPGCHVDFDFSLSLTISGSAGTVYQLMFYFIKMTINFEHNPNR